MALSEYFICEGVKWIDITEPSMPEMEKISKTYNLHYQLVRDCMQPDHLPKYDSVNDVNFLILRYFSGAADRKMATIQELSNKIAIFYTKDFLITIHKDRIQFLENIRKKYIDSNRCSGPEEAVTKILWSGLETFDDPAQKLSEQIDSFENQILLKTVTNQQVEALYHIKRQAAISNKILMLMSEPINHIRMIPKDDPALQDVKDQHLKIITLYTQILEEVNNLMGLYMSFAAQKTNDVVKVLTIFSVFFMPLTFIAGIYGMNFEFMPELRQQWGYPGVLLLMVIVSLIIFTWFKKKGWL
ncbi:MAG: CorA family divalent cation transporter [Chitinophagaceae bacterium]